MSVNYTLVWNQTLSNRTLACFTNSLAFTLLLLATTFKKTLGLFGFVPHFSEENQGNFVLTKTEASYCKMGVRYNQEPKKI